MGGLTEPIADIASKAMDTLYEGSKDTPYIRHAVEGVWSMGRNLEASPIGQDVKSMILKGIGERQKALTNLRAPIDKFQEVAKADADVAKAHDYKNASIAQIHNSFPVNHPARQALTPLMQNPANHNITLYDAIHTAQGRANLAGRTKAFGPDGAYLTAALHPMLTSGNPTDVSEAQAYMDIASQVFRDSTEVNRGGRVTKESLLKGQVAEAVNKNLPEDKKIKINVGRTYIPGDELEEASHRMTHNILAPGIAIVHLSDFLKLPANSPARVLWNTMQTLDDPTINAMKNASGIFTHTMHSIYDNDFRYRTGAIAKRLGSPDAAAIFHKMWHQPAFNNVRMKQLSIFGTAAYHQTQVWGKQAFHGNRYAMDSLRDLNLDPQKIIQRGGVLSKQELEDGIFHFVNNRLFIDKPLEHAKWTKNNPFFRIAFDLHGYATRESRYVFRELYKLMKNNEYGKLAQFVGVLGIVFPIIAPLIKSAGTLVRTASPEESEKEFKKDYGGLFHPSGIGDFASTYLDLISHFAGVGAYMSYLHAATNSRLMNAIAGPLPGKVAKTVEDVSRGIFKPSRAGRLHSLIPFGRDVTESVPLIGPWASKRIFPKRR